MHDGKNGLTERCENCGNPILPTDTVCWHCGWQIRKRPQTKTPSRGRSLTARFRPPRQVAERDMPAMESYDLRAIALYGALTLLIVVALLAMMRSLGSHPLLVASADLRLGADWTSVTDNELRYTLSLPAGWQWLDGAYLQRQALVEELAADQPHIAQAFAPFGEAAEDLELLAIGFQPQPPESEEPLTFVAVGRSQHLGQLAPQQLLDMLAGQALTVSGADVIEDILGQPQARFGLFDSERLIQCRSLFTSAANAESPTGYVVVTCVPQDNFGRIQRDLEDILDSFQLLQHK